MSQDPLDVNKAKVLVDNFAAKGAVFTLHEFYWQWKAECNLSHMKKISNI